MNAGDLGPAAPNGILVIEADKVKSSKVMKRKTCEERYRECMDLCQDICCLMSQTGGVTFEVNVGALRSLKNLLQQGTKFAVVTLNENHDPQGNYVT